MGIFFGRLPRRVKHMALLAITTTKLVFEPVLALFTTYEIPNQIRHDTRENCKQRAHELLFRPTSLKLRGTSAKF